MQSAVGQQAPRAFDLVGVWGQRGAGYSICIICSICETICLVISLNIYFHQSAQLDRDELGSIIYDGSHDVSEHIREKTELCQVLHSGLDPIQDAIVSARNPVVKLLASFGTSCKSGYSSCIIEKILYHVFLTWECYANTNLNEIITKALMTMVTRSRRL